MPVFTGALLVFAAHHNVNANRCALSSDCLHGCQILLSVLSSCMCEDGGIGCPGYLTDNITQLRLLFPLLSHVNSKAGVRSVLGKKSSCARNCKAPVSGWDRWKQKKRKLGTFRRRNHLHSSLCILFNRFVLPGGSAQPAPGKCTHVHIKLIWGIVVIVLDVCSNDQS